MQAKGHRNITSQHKNTLEFTTEKTLTKRGDCIVAVDFKFNKEEIKKILQYQKIKITIKAGNIKEEIFAYPNKKFSDFNEFVIRKSDFISKRTFAIKSNKSAYDLDDRLKKELQKNPQKRGKHHARLSLRTVRRHPHPGRDEGRGAFSQGADR